MATVKARGQVTIVDLNDAKQVQLLMDIKYPVQMYNPDTKVFTPNFGSDNNVVTPKVYVTGNGTNLVSNLTSLKYDVGGTVVNAGATSGQYSVATIPAGGALTIKGNITGNSLPIKITAVYHDDDTEQDTTLEAQGFIAKTANAGALFQVVLTQPKGNSFDASNNIATLMAEAKCFRGGTQDTDGITYKWYSLNLKTQAWEALTQGFTTAGGVSTLSVKASDVLNVQTFKCEAIDGTDRAEAIVTFEDRTDPYTLELFSPTGLQIKNGQGLTTLCARLYRGSELIESETTASQKFTYTWTKFDKNGAKSNFAGTSSAQKTGNPLTVSANDIEQKATFYCEVSQ